jgi:hypothetical protein
VSADDCWHYGRVGHAPPAHPQLRIDHAVVVATHSAGADGMEEGVRTCVDGLFEGVVVELGRAARSDDVAEDVC